MDMKLKAFLVKALGGVKKIFCKLCQSWDNLNKVRSSIMAILASRGFLLILVIVDFLTSSTLEVSSLTRYRKLASNNEEDLILFKSASPCGLVLATIVELIIDRYNLENQILCILKDKVMEDNCLAETFEDLLKFGNRNVITVIADAKNSSLRYNIFQKPTIYLLLSTMDTSTMLKRLIDFGKIGATWNPRGFYIGLTESKLEAVNLMKKLLKNFIYKVVVLVVNKNNNNFVVEAYTWRPYHPVNNCGPPTIDNLIRLGRYRDSFEFEKESNATPGMLPNKFGNCPLNVSYTVWPPYVISLPNNRTSGMEVTLMNLISEKIGLKLEPKYFNHKANRDYTEVYVGSILPRSVDLEKYHISVPYIEDTLVWLVPCQREIDVFEMVRKLSFSIWGPSFLAMFFAALSLLFSECKYWILWVWGSFWEQSNDKIPNEVRLIWGCWLFLCLHLSVVYKTALVSQLTAAPKIRGEADSQANLLKTDLKLGFIVQAEHWFNREDDVERGILDRYIVCETVAKCYNEIPKGRALFTNVMMAKYLTAGQNGSEFNEVCYLPTSLTYKVAMLFAKGHAAAQIFDNYLEISKSSGFVNLVLKEVENMELKITRRRPDSTAEKMLTFQQVYSAFYVLAIGLGLAGVSFIWELFRYSLFVRRF